MTNIDTLLNNVKRAVEAQTRIGPGKTFAVSNDGYGRAMRRLQEIEEELQELQNLHGASMGIDKGINTAAQLRTEYYRVSARAETIKNQLM